jgi:hypothetical protein
MCIGHRYGGLQFGALVGDRFDLVCISEKSDERRVDPRFGLSQAGELRPQSAMRLGYPSGAVMHTRIGGMIIGQIALASVNV